MPGETETLTRFSAPVNLVMQSSWFSYPLLRLPLRLSDLGRALSGDSVVIPLGTFCDEIRVTHTEAVSSVAQR